MSVGGARDRVGDQVREGDLAPARLELAPARVERGHGRSCGSSSRSGSSGSLHVARERRGAAAASAARSPRRRASCAAGGARCRCAPAASTSALVMRPAGPAARDAREVDALGGGGARGDGRDLRVAGGAAPAAGRRVAGAAAALRRMPRSRWIARRRDRGRGTDRDARDHLSDGDRVALGDEHLGDRAARRAPAARRRPCRSRSRRSSRRPDRVADLDVPFEDRSLGDRLAGARGSRCRRSTAGRGGLAAPAEPSLAVAGWPRARARCAGLGPRRSAWTRCRCSAQRPTGAGAVHRDARDAPGRR